MTVLLDGYVTDAEGTIGWTAPSEELHRFHNEQARSLGAHILGRRLYEVMRVWETGEMDGEGEVAEEFAAIWNPLPKVVFSHTLSAVAGNARLATGSLADEVAALRQQTDGDIGIGGATLAAAATAAGLIDEYRLFVVPVVLGAGTRYFGDDPVRLDLELVESQTIDGQTAYLRYQPRR